MATLPNILVAQTGVPAQVEAKFTMLPKLSTFMTKIANMLPAGPDVPFPAAITTAPTLPALPDIFKGPTTTAAQRYLPTGSVQIIPGHPPVGLQTKNIAQPTPAGGLTNTVIERRGV